MISETSLPTSKINQGCISDCNKFKLEVRMPVVCDMSEFPMGSHVRILGVIKYALNSPYLFVDNKDNVTMESVVSKSIGSLLRGTKPPTKRSPPEEPSTPDNVSYYIAFKYRKSLMDLIIIYFLFQKKKK